MMERILYGSAYYHEYLPYERCRQDAEMMAKAGFNVVRIAESTWSTCEPQDGVFDFHHVEHVMDVMEEHGISVIIGTPTYAVPAWLVRKYPDILAETADGKSLYGRRQNMDITNTHYRFYAERVIRKLMEVTCDRKCVIGYQIDNETKYYGVTGKNVQQGFADYLKEKFDGDCDKLNDAYGLDYWSNRINTWDDFPDVTGTINGSLAAEFDHYRRKLVTEFLSWQADIVAEYKRKDQFITHNMDFEWRNYSFGIQPDCEHNHIAPLLTVAGCDIYHPSQDELTGEEIAFGGDVTRSLKQDNYFVLETEAQGFPCWTPYPGQLRLQAYGHVASGASMVSYWPWHSIHNSFETYWRGVLSHDLQENAVYKEAGIVGNEWKRLGKHLCDIKIKNQAAVVVSNKALSALKYFKIDSTNGINGQLVYNDVVRKIYDRMYHNNISCDIIWEEDADFSAYDLLVVPALYSASEETLYRLCDYVEKGRTLVMTFKSCFADENLKVYHDMQPHILHEAAGVTYQSFFLPRNETVASCFAELLCPEEGTEVLLRYENPAWKDYAAITQNTFGKGTVFYLGCMPEQHMLDEILLKACHCAGIKLPHSFEDEEGEQESDHTVFIRRGMNALGKKITFYLNYSAANKKGIYEGKNGVELLSGSDIASGQMIVLKPWDVAIVEEN